MLIFFVVACGEETKQTPGPQTQNPSATTGNLTGTQTPSNITAAPVVPTVTQPLAISPTKGSPGNTNSAALKTEVRVLMNQLWQTYKTRYIQQDGRVKDPQRTDASTSEGQSYALLRAFWEDDKTTFDNVLNWAINNMQTARGDKLFAYLWGKNDDRNWTVMDKSAATDADQDIAFALILASSRWNDPSYQTKAIQIMNDIWNKTVVTVNNKPYLTAGDWAPSMERPVLNPSYFAPYEYRIFSQVDPDKTHNWMGLVDTSYEIIKKCTDNKLDTSSGKLPPNWCAIDKQSGDVMQAQDQGKGFDTDYGYDAFRTVWRLALDNRWNGEKRALNYLQSLTTLQNDWTNKQKLAVVYDHSGQIKDNAEDLGIYAGSGVALFTTIDPPKADQIVSTKILPGLRDIGKDDPDPAHEDPTKARTYYSQNWTWFGLALYSDTLQPPGIS